MSQSQAEKNLADWKQCFGEFKAIIKAASVEELESYIAITKKESPHETEDEIRSFYAKIRNDLY